MQKIKYYSCYSNKYSEIKTCDLEPFSEIRSQLMPEILLYAVIV